MSKQAMIDLLTQLSQDPPQCQEFKEDPDLVMASLDLTPQEKELLKSNDHEEIQAYLGDEGSAPAVTCRQGT